MSTVETLKPLINQAAALTAPRLRVRVAFGVLAPWICAALLLVALALAMPINHDEGQYVAAEAMANTARPYIDFAYLQSPLQLYVAGPVAALFAGHAFLALRMLNALMGLGLLAIVFAGQRMMGVDRSRAALATALMASSYVFQFSVAVARNDVLPALLEGMAMLLALCALKGGPRPVVLWSLTGLALALAASAKVSYVLVLGAAGLFVLATALRRRISVLALLGFGAGAAAGLLPCLLGWASAPEAFEYDVYGFAAHAPLYWYRLIGQGGRLGLPVKLSESLFHLAIGPTLGVLASVAVLVVQRWRAKDRTPARRRFIEILALAGLAAALTPTPVQRQYFMPMLAPLFILWGRIDAWDWVSIRPPLKRALFALTALGAVAGTGRALYVLADGFAGQAVHGGAPAVRLTKEARWLGSRMRAAHVHGAVASLSPQVTLDSGFPIERRFISGPFVYRSGDVLTDAQLERLHVANPRSLVKILDRERPAAIVTGYERAEGPARRNLDDDFRAYAVSRGYTRELSPLGQAVLYLRPAAH
jgi:hypothetical protein